MKTRWPSYRNGYPSRTSAERGSPRCGPRGRDDLLDSADGAPWTPAPHLADTLRRSRVVHDTRTRRGRRFRSTPRSECAPKRRHPPRAHHDGCAQKLPRRDPFGHLRPVSVHARHEGSGRRTLGLHLSLPKRSPTRRPFPRPLLGRSLVAPISPDLGDRQQARERTRRTCPRPRRPLLGGACLRGAVVFVAARSGAAHGKTSCASLGGVRCLK